MKWFNVKDKLPEIYPALRDDIDGLEKTVKLIALTDCGTVTDNRRVRSRLGKKEWEWFMGYDGEVVTHWTFFTEPDDK